MLTVLAVVGSFALEKLSQNKSSFTHRLCRFTWAQWYRTHRIVWLPCSTPHPYFVDKAVPRTMMALQHPFSQAPFRDSRQTQTRLASVQCWAPVVPVCCTHWPTQCKHFCNKSILSQLDVKLFQDLVVLSDKKMTIQWALLIYHWWLCAIHFQKLVWGYGAFYLVLLFNLSVFPFLKISIYWAREYNLWEH